MSRKREQLLGYLLGALDEPERLAVQRELEANPQLREELEQLRQALQPLEEIREEYEPPADLASRTCRLVASVGDARLPESTPPAPPVVESIASVQSASMLDIVVAAGICIALSLLFFPALLSSREMSRRHTCQDNLRQLAFALAAYDHTFECAPTIPMEGNEAFAGYYAVTLQHAGLLNDFHVLVCPGGSWPDRDDVRRVPSVEEIVTASGASLSNLQRVAGGSYGYNIGYWDGRGYRAPRMQRDSSILVMTDAPDASRPTTLSINHGGQGMNVLFADARVVFLRGCTIPTPNRHRADHAFLNHDGQVAMGLGHDDSVIASSETRPRE